MYTHWLFGWPSCYLLLILIRYDTQTIEYQLQSSPRACDKLIRLTTNSSSVERNMTVSVGCRYPGGDCTSDIWLVENETN